ncbi:alpha-L-rhamnosidase [Saccharopolyspora aridisoli]|uniref:alpha-L-rhamnosidase n=1 Tax=Saccharopolyspora aridisoli TaxID=2530385 RepID=A0A4R4UV91_9PSEU|nr:glycoside hydrolase family 78 protein [Saccharopolyspora aridisoli]TDC92633.1 alpha-L-rhamnosidase [Saccharopolyspora aridisoli]
MIDSVIPHAPTIENHREPIGIGADAPRLSWTTSAPAGWAQRAYELEITRGDRVAKHGPFSDDESRYRPWPESPLAPRESASVRVRVHGDGVSEWSEPAVVERGLTAADWVAVPVGGDPGEPGTERRPWLVRRGFSLRGPIASARLYVTAHGLAEAEINGRRVGDDVLSPGWSTYSQRLRYRTHDVTDLLVEGDNAIGAWLADGWYRGRIGFRGGARDRYGTDQSLIAQLELTYFDGGREIIATGPGWVAAPSPILSSSIYDGETFDARQVPHGWSEAGFDDSGWNPVHVFDRDPATLVAPDGPPVRRTRVVRPARGERRAPDRLLVDFGQNLVGRLAIAVRGEAGQEVVIRHAEVLQDGEICTRPLRQAAQTDRYVLAGRGTEEWEPRFTFHGFRYAEVTAPPAVLDVLELEARVLHSDLRRTGWFACSDPDLNTLHDNVLWSMRGNFVDLPTDCPQRDERLGWTGDIQVFARTAGFLHDVTGMLSSWLRDLAIEQNDDGAVPVFVPTLDDAGSWDMSDPIAAWGDAGVLTPWDLYVASGDRLLLERQWDSAKAWVDLLDRRCGDDRLWTGDHQLGDWLDPAAPPDDPAAATTDRELVASAYFAHSARRLAGIAEVLGRADDAEHYGALASEVRAAIRDRWTDGEGALTEQSQCGYALLLAFGILEDPATRSRAGERLRDLVVRADHRISTGFVGTPLVSEALSSTGGLDVAYRQLQERGCPSWLYPVTMGATTTWERWDSMLPDGTVNPGEMTSFNHYALGAVAHWMHNTIAGLAPAVPGWRRIRFAPRPGGGLTWARGAYDGPYGRVAIDWSIEDDTLAVRTAVPANCTAVLHLPDGTTRELRSGGAVHTCPMSRDRPA